MARPSPDRPTTDDRLNFRSYVLPIVRTIRDAARANQLPLTIGIFGRWGSGKTSLMSMVAEELGPTLEEARIAKERGETSRRLLRWAVPLLAFWLLLVLAGLLLIVVGARWLHNTTGIQTLQAQILWASAMTGALGGLVVAFYVVWMHGYVECDLNPSHLRGIALRPILGMLAGLVVFLLLWGLTRLFWKTAVLNIVVYILFAFLFGSADWLYSYLWSALRTWVTRRLRGDENLLKQSPSREAAAQRTEARRYFQVIWFNAWKFANEDELWAALLQEVLRQIKVKATGGERLRIKWQLWKRSIDWNSSTRDVARKLLPTTGKLILAAGLAYLGGQVATWAVSSRYGVQIGQTAGAVGALLTGLLPVSAWLRANIVTPAADIDFDKYRKKASYKDHLTFLADFSKEFREVTEIARGKNNPLVLMLDDLDRCLPEKAISVLEAIKLFISEDAPVVFLIGADQEFIERAIEVKYEKLIARDDPNLERRERFSRLGREYLEKIVQLSFHLPPIEETLIDRFIDDVFKDNSWVVDYSHIFAAGLQPNPRQVLRVLNIYNFMIELAQEKKWLYASIIQPDVLAKTVVVQYRWPELWSALVDRQDLLGVLEKFYQDGLPPADPALAGLVAKFSSDSDLRSLLMVKDSGQLAGVDLRNYIYLSESTQTRTGQSEGGTPIPEKPPVKRPRRRGAAKPEAEALALKSVEEHALMTLEEVKRMRTSWQQLGLSARRITGYENRIKRARTAGDMQALEAAQEEFQDILASYATRRVEEVKQKHVDLSKLRDSLSQQRADSALMALMSERLERAAKAMESNDFEAAMVQLDEAALLGKQAQAGLSARQEKATKHAIDARLSNDGRLVFQRAVTYEQIEVKVDVPGPGKPGKIFVYSGQEPVVAVLPKLDKRLWDIRAGLARDEFTPEEKRQLSEGLGERMRPLLQLIQGAPPDSRYRLRLTLTSTGVDDLPWEMAILEPDNSLPLGLDPRYAVVRDHPLLTDRSALDLGRLSPKMLVLSTSDENHYQLDLLRRIRFPFDIRILTGPGSTTDTFNAAFKEERPAILHLVSADQEDSSQKAPGFDVMLDFELLRDYPGLVVFSLPDGQTLARSAFGEGVPAVLAWQLGINQAAAEAFYFPFYNALLRSGQPEFAITEGRRAIAAALGDGSPLAVSPVLYLNGGTGEIP